MYTSQSRRSGVAKIPFPRLVAPTNKNLIEIAGPIVAQWLIQAARERGTITYGEACSRLEDREHFGRIGRATRLGLTAGTLMERLQEVDPKVPLLNVLLVLQKDRRPSDGAGSFLAERFGVPLLRHRKAREKYPDLWRCYSDQAAKEVYAYEHWSEIYERTYRQRWKRSNVIAAPSKEGSEKDGISRGRGGEGPHHRYLRLWAKEHPQEVLSKLAVQRSETEVDLPSGDRVDVVYYAADRTIAIEVKSRDSNAEDLTRGVYQCVKYKAVLRAMDMRLDPPVSALLVTETHLPAAIAELAKNLRVGHKCVGLIGSQ
jgi:hypothetical protein